MWNPMSSVCFCIVKENVLKNKIKKKEKQNIGLGWLETADDKYGYI